ncbi:MAG TPA: glucosyl-3-phosphoglycerate synthase [Acidimicrobiales bacterium]|nr:glucosyl-3-phosphoglycerate synthase [Acidimicrobiales bacterium]
MSTLLRTSHGDFAPTDVAARKGDLTVAVCLPARDEEATVGTIVETLRHDLQEVVALVDELVVVDDHSEDATARVAQDAGARVVDARTTLPAVTGAGKGAALWKSLHETTSDLVVWVDADITEFSSHFAAALIGTLVENPEVSFVKGAYDRPLVEGEGGGRVTELVARPALAMLFPELTVVAQPLAGEYGGRRALLETLPFVQGYGVDIALLIDAHASVGMAGLAEVDLGVRRHRNRTIGQLGPQGAEVLRAALVRAGVPTGDEHLTLRRPGLPPLALAHDELAPLVELDSYRRSP